MARAKLSGALLTRRNAPLATTPGRYLSKTRYDADAEALGDPDPARSAPLQDEAEPNTTEATRDLFHRTVAAPQAPTDLDPPVMRITAEKAIQHLYDDLRDQLRAKHHERAVELFEELLHSGRPLSEIIAESQRGPVTSKTSEPGYRGHSRSTDACEAAPEPDPEPTSERALRSTAQSAPLSVPEPMIEGADWSTVDHAAQQGGGSAAGNPTIISQTPVSSGEPVHQRYGATHWFGVAGRTTGARRSPIIRFCIALCGATAVAIGGVLFLHGNSETGATISAPYVSISSNTPAVAGARTEPRTAVAGASAPQTEPVAAVASAPIPGLATTSNPLPEAARPQDASAAVAPAESTQPQSTAADARPEAAPTPAPAARPEEAPPIDAAALTALGLGTAPAVAMLAAPEPEEPRASTAESLGLMARGDALFGVGDVASARLFYERAANVGVAQAALRLGETYDPSFLALARLHGVRGDLAVATRWYRRARDLGASEAEILLKSLEDK